MSSESVEEGKVSTGKIILGAILTIFLVLWVWALIDVLKAGDMNFKQFADNGQIIWLIIILCVPFGCLAYGVVEKRMLFEDKGGVEQFSEE